MEVSNDDNEFLNDIDNKSILKYETSKQLEFIYFTSFFYF